ncbi:MAG: flagellar biosynthesis protein FlhF [Lachnospirales bacterium]
MRIKTYSGKTEAEAVENAKIELGENMTILHIRKISKNHFIPFFNKSKYEVTAAIDSNYSNNLKQDTNKFNNVDVKEQVEKDKLIDEQKAKINELNEKIANSNELIGTLSRDIMLSNPDDNLKKDVKYKNECLQQIHDRLKNQEVIEPLIDYLLLDLVRLDNDEIDRKVALKHCYDKMVELIGHPQAIKPQSLKYSKSPVLFMGPTGVGKTTTIAKLASKFMLEDSLVVGLITADTYRIAAIEQLRTYAEILSIDVEVVYNEEDMRNSHNKMLYCKDVVLIDTAGRSHKYSENVLELKSIIASVPNVKKYLVISLTTKVDDLIQIVETYSKDFDFGIIFTKFDETSTYGSILNVRYMTGKELSYINYGQTVPNDIKVLDADEVARAILGLGGR